MRRQGSPPGLLFRLIVPATAIFIITIFALLVAPYSDQKAPLWKFLDRNGDRIILAEFTAVLVLSFLAMAWDRRQILKQQREGTQSPDDRSASTTDPRPDGEG